MKTISDVIIISIALALTLIGLHQSVMVGFARSYWILMIAVFLFLWYAYRKIK